MSDDKWTVLIGCLTSVPMIIFYIIVLAAVFNVLSPNVYANKAGIIHSLVDEGIRLFQGMKR